MVTDKCPKGPNGLKGLNPNGLKGLNRLSPNGLNPLFAPPISPIFALCLSTKNGCPKFEQPSFVKSNRLKSVLHCLILSMLLSHALHVAKTEAELCKVVD